MQPSQIYQHQEQKPIQKVLDELRIIKLELSSIKRDLTFIKQQVEVPDFTKIETPTEIENIGWRLW